MAKVKKVLLKTAKILMIFISLISIMLVVFSLGDASKTTTQIGTIFGSLFFPALIIVFAILFVPQVVFLVRNKRAGIAVNKFSVVTLAFTLVALVSMSLIFHSMAQAVRNGGGNINIFQALSQFGDASDDGKVVYATKDGEELTISIYNAKKTDPDALSPAYVYIHGGGWSSSDSESSVLHRQMADEGYVGFSINSGTLLWKTVLRRCSGFMSTQRNMAATRIESF